MAAIQAGLTVPSLSILAAGDRDKPASGPAAPAPPEPVVIARDSRNLAGWTVRVDRSLLPGGTAADLGATAIGLLEADLRRIRILMKPEILAKLQAIPIVVDRECGDLRPMQYHPS